MTSSAWGGCTFDRVWIDATFEGARANGCRLEARGAIDIRIAPENTPINPRDGEGVDASNIERVQATEVRA